MIFSRSTIAGACLAIGVGTLYITSLAPVVQGFDSAELTVGAYTLGFVHPPGYPLYMVLGHVFSHIPIGTVGLRMNLFSALCGVLTVYLVFRLAIAQGTQWQAAIIAALLLASAPDFWSQAIRAEVYTLHTAIMASVLLLWQNNAYYRSFGLLGLGLAHHPTTVLLWLSIALIVIWNRQGYRHFLYGSLLSILIMIVCYVYIPLRAGSSSIDYITPYFAITLSDVQSIWWMLSFRPFQQAFQFNPTGSLFWIEVIRLGLNAWSNLLGIGIGLARVGWRQIQHKQPGWNGLLTIYLLANCAGFLSYYVIDKDVMFLPLYIVTSLWIAESLPAVTQAIARFAPNARHGQGLVYVTLLLVIVLNIGLNWSSINLNNNRRIYEYSVELIDSVAPGTLIINHWSTASVLDYLRIVENRRPDVYSFNLDFYNLGLQAQGLDINSQQARTAWFTMIRSQFSKHPLCVIEPLPELPRRLAWIRDKKCWVPIERGG